MRDKNACRLEIISNIAINQSAKARARVNEKYPKKIIPQFRRSNMDAKRAKSKNLGWWWPPICMAAGVLIYYLLILKLNALPEPLMRAHEV